MGKKSKKKCKRENDDVENQVKLCEECNQWLPKRIFTKKEWKLSEHRCKPCINKMEKEVDVQLAALLAEEISDEDLFKEPPPKDDCAICCLRLPLEEELCSYQTCCGQRLCGGCLYDMSLSSLPPLCPFCRTQEVMTDEDVIKRYKKRVKLNDPDSLFCLGCKYGKGSMGVPQHHTKAFLCWIRAGEMGHPDAFALVGERFRDGMGVEIDAEKEAHFYKRAAMLGHANSRFNLGVFEVQSGPGRPGGQDGWYTRALRHFKISAMAGHKNSLDQVRTGFEKDFVSKDEYEETLRGYYDSLQKMISESREVTAPVILRNMDLINDPGRYR